MDPFDRILAVPDPWMTGSGPLDDRIRSLLRKGSIIEIREEKHQKPAMRRPFLMTGPMNPETGEKTLLTAPAELVGFRLIYCGVRTGP